MRNERKVSPALRRGALGIPDERGSWERMTVVAVRRGNLLSISRDNRPIVLVVAVGGNRDSGSLGGTTWIDYCRLVYV
jgi:hypothetical protein